MKRTMKSPHLLVKLIKHLSLVVLVAILALLAIVWVKRPSGSQNQPQILIGDLGGMKVNIPAYYVDLMEYDGDPGWSGKRNDPSPVRTYQSRMASFGVQVRYPDMAGLSSQAMWIDRDKYKAADTPWISLTILSGPNYPGDGFLDRLARGVVDGIRTDWSDDFKKQDEKQLGLDLYVLQGMSPTGDMPAREVPATGDDRYIHHTEDGRIKTYIKCQNAKYSAVLCQQSFSMEGDGLHVEVRILYRRTMLEHWEDIQEKARRLILSWKAPEMPDSIAASTSSLHR